MSAARVELADLRACACDGAHFAGLTATEASLARVVDRAGADFILVGDSLGMTVQGRDTTAHVGMDDMVYHTRCVERGRRRALLLADMPHLSFPDTPTARANAKRLLDAGADAVKLEATDAQVDIVRALRADGIAVCAHLGLRPQSLAPGAPVRRLGRGAAERAELCAQARALENAGADLLLLECVVPEAARSIVARARVPVIGIGSGRCHGQVLVLHDILGVSARTPAHARDFLAEGGSVAGAVRRYCQAVRTGAFP